MATHEKIWELALTHLGHTGETVDDYSNPQTDAQFILSRCYPNAIELALGLYDWGFARRRVRPTDITASHIISPEWTYAWSVPADLVRVLGFTIQQPKRKIPKIPYEITQSISTPATRVMYTHIDPFESTHYLIYTARVTTVSFYTEQFAMVLSAVLAAEAAIPMSKGVGFMETMMNFAMKRTMEGHEIVADEDHGVPQRSSIELARD